MSTVAQEVQNLDTDPIIELFQLDLTSIPNASGVYYFVNGLNEDGTAITFGGQPYTSVDFKTEGWQYDGSGPFPRPTMQISNVGGFLSSLVYTLNDLIGAKVTRIRTFAKYLDGGSEPDSGKTLPIDTYVIFQKRKHNKKLIEFILSAQADQQGVMLPRRQILRDTCTHSYRIWTGTAWDYSQASCPYTGNNYFNKGGSSVPTPAEDKPNYQLITCCQKRFGKTNLPTRAFPGVVRVKI